VRLADVDWREKGVPYLTWLDRQIAEIREARKTLPPPDVTLNDVGVSTKMDTYGLKPGKTLGEQQRKAKKSKTK
jgi:hypothetical protein